MYVSVSILVFGNFLGGVISAPLSNTLGNTFFLFHYHIDIGIHASYYFNLTFKQSQRHGHFTFCSPRHLNNKTELSWELLNSEYRE